MKSSYDNYALTECTTTIKEAREDGWYSFENTVFWGEKGGMLEDRGTINGVKVTGLKWEGDTLWHQTAEPVSDPIEMKIDYETRLANTAPQTALHILDGYYSAMGIHITSTGTRPENEYYDIDSKDMPKDHLEQVQAYINDAIRKDVPVAFSYIKGSEYPDPEYARFPEVRIVKIGDLNTQPCGTPHVNHTSEIGSFTILYAENTNKGMRIHFTCGPVTSKRLLKYYGILKELGQVLSCGEEQLVERAKELSTTSKEQKGTITALQTKLMKYQVMEYAVREDKVIVLPADMNMHSFCQELLKVTKISRGILQTGAKGTSFSIISPDSKARDYLNELKKQVPGGGGGSFTIVSGKSPSDPDKLKAALEAIL